MTSPRKIIELGMEKRRAVIIKNVLAMALEDKAKCANCYSTMMTTAYIVNGNGFRLSCTKCRRRIWVENRQTGLTRKQFLSRAYRAGREIEVQESFLLDLETTKGKYNENRKD